jgi:hypothetical protein
VTPSVVVTSWVRWLLMYLPHVPVGGRAGR